MRQHIKARDVSTIQEGFTAWVEHGEWFMAPTVPPEDFGAHDYEDGGFEKGIRECKCGCKMHLSSSSGPVNPFGACPMNPINKDDVDVIIAREAHTKS